MDVTQRASKKPGRQKTHHLGQQWGHARHLHHALRAHGHANACGLQHQARQARERAPRVSSGTPACTRSRASLHETLPGRRVSIGHRHPFVLPLAALQPQRRHSALPALVQAAIHHCSARLHQAASRLALRHRPATARRPSNSSRKGGAEPSVSMSAGFRRTSGGRPSDTSMPSASRTTGCSALGLTDSSWRTTWRAMSQARPAHPAPCAAACRHGSTPATCTTALQALGRFLALLGHIVVHARCHSSVACAWPWAKALGVGLVAGLLHQGLLRASSRAGRQLGCGLGSGSGSGGSRSEPSTAPNFHCVTSPTSSLGMKREYNAG
jgi:hypothetical protein